jgi:hypothetical protein
MGLGINYVIRANHLVSLITSSTTDPRLSEDLRQLYHSKRKKKANIQILCLNIKNIFAKIVLVKLTKRDRQYEVPLETKMKIK